MSKFIRVLVILIFIGCDILDDDKKEDCSGEPGGNAFIDDCGECVMGNTGKEANWAKDCNDECFGGAIIDCEGICDGVNVACYGCTNTNALNFDDSATIDDGSCLWEWEQSTNQAFYFIHEVYNIEGEPIQEDIDFVGAFNGTQCVGSRVWSGSDVDIPVMGKDGSLTDYLNDDEIPEFRIYISSGNVEYKAEYGDQCFESINYQTPTSCGFANTKMYFIPVLSATELINN